MYYTLLPAALVQYLILVLTVEDWKGYFGNFQASAYLGVTFTLGGGACQVPLQA